MFKNILKKSIFGLKKLIYTNMLNRKKIKISICLDKDVVETVEKLTTNKSYLIERLLLEYAITKNIKINDIIL